MGNTNYVFLLGGHDLEMIGIRNILDSKGISYWDKQLSWDNARVSRYKEHFNDKNFFVGIELETDVTPPKNYTPIDHHNEKSDQLSSIEQVATLLKLELTREQQLIAANDKGYIPAMEAMGATKEEIEDIRRRDRASQGVTGKDEKRAERSIRENKRIENGIVVIKSLTDRFSAVSDKQYPFRRLIVFSDKKLVYYGENAGKLSSLFPGHVEDEKCYSGGGTSGYFGFKEDRFRPEELLTIKNKILEKYGITKGRE
jgi:hypothetical protein